MDNKDTERLNFFEQHADWFRYSGTSTVTMDGKYPCWSVWTPKEGRTARKTLREAIDAAMEDINIKKIHQSEYTDLCMRTNFYIAKGLRKGQSYMNALREINPAVYSSVTATEDDPFYDDSKIPRFLACILP